MIAPRLKPFARPVAGLTYHPQNPRSGDVDAIADSLKRFGQVKPIVVQQSTGYVIAGNHVLRAARALGWKQVAVVEVDCDDATATAYLLADNRMSDLGTFDRALLGDLLSRLAVLDGTGYTQDDIDALMGEQVRSGVDTSGGPSGALTSVIDFHTEAALNRWFAWTNSVLRFRYPDLPTRASRIARYIEETVE